MKSAIALVLFLLIIPSVSADKCQDYVGDIHLEVESFEGWTSTNSYSLNFKEFTTLRITEISIINVGDCDIPPSRLILKITNPWGENNFAFTRYEGIDTPQILKGETIKSSLLGSYYNYNGFLKNKSIIGKSLDYEGIWNMEYNWQTKNGEFISNSLTLNNYFFNGRSRNFKVVSALDFISLENSEKIGKISIIALFLVTFLSIIISTLALRFFTNKQIKKMDEHYKKTIEKEEQREEEKQFDLLNIILLELKFLEDNLKSYKNSFSKKNHYPMWDLWNIDVATYIKTLSHKISKKDTIKLKEKLMKIKDKISIINNMEVQSKKDTEERGNEELIRIRIEAMRNKIVITIDELLSILKISKQIIKKNWSIE